MYRVNLEKLHAKSYKNIANIESQRIIIRSCLNVAVDENGKVTDATRLNESMPLIKELAGKVKTLVIMAHLGRPTERTQSTSFWNIAELMNAELNKKNITVKLVNDLTPDAILEIQNNTNQNQVFLLENIRYFKGEESKDQMERTAFVQQLSSLTNVFINDAFADYREAASTYDIAQVLPSYLGPVFLKEVESLSQLNNPQRPFIAVIGGAKLSEKLDALMALAEIADKVLVGGAMAYTLMKAKGISVGSSKVEDDKLDIAKEVNEKYGYKILLPLDHMVASEFSKDAPHSYTDEQEIEGSQIAIDIGIETIKKYSLELQGAASILWNGPMGVFEWDHSAIGTKEIGLAMAQNDQAYKVAGGGDSIAAINSLGLKGFNHISTGGGAMLALLAYDKFAVLDVILG